MEKKKHPGGRPSRYNESFHPKLIELLTRLGFTDKEAAEYLGICEKTLNNWKLKHKEFLQSLKIGKDQIDDQVENALLKRALGFKKEAIKIFQYKGEIITGKYDEYYPPEVGAICFWLKNRRKEKWKDRWDLTVQGDFNVMDYDIPVSEEDVKHAREQLDLFLKRDDE